MKTFKGHQPSAPNAEVWVLIHFHLVFEYL
jgi:hypothetical protein